VRQGLRRLGCCCRYVTLAAGFGTNGPLASSGCRPRQGSCRRAPTGHGPSPTNRLNEHTVRQLLVPALAGPTTLPPRRAAHVALPARPGTRWPSHQALGAQAHPFPAPRPAQPSRPDPASPLRPHPPPPPQRKPRPAVSQSTLHKLPAPVRTGPSYHRAAALNSDQAKPLRADTPARARRAMASGPQLWQRQPCPYSKWRMRLCPPAQALTGRPTRHQAPEPALTPPARQPNSRGAPQPTPSPGPATQPRHSENPRPRRPQRACSEL
jgi:hypothetical protein